MKIILPEPAALLGDLADDLIKQFKAGETSIRVNKMSIVETARMLKNRDRLQVNDDE